MTETDIEAAGGRWLERWTEGPTEPQGSGLARGDTAPSRALRAETGAMVHLDSLWSQGPALIMFWRHFGCSCGVDRAARLVAEAPAYEAAGIRLAVVSQGEPERAARYRAEHKLPCTVLCDPSLDAYRAFGLGQWSVDRVLFDAPPEYLAHTREQGLQLQESRRATRPVVDDPWRATGEFLVGRDGTVLTSHLAQHCEDYPEPRMFVAAARAGS